MARQRFINNMITSLLQDVSETDTTFIIDNKYGQLSALTYGDYYLATIVPRRGFGSIEIVKITAVEGNSITVERGWEGTPAQKHLFGDGFEMRNTAGTYDTFTENTLTKNIRKIHKNFATNYSSPSIVLFDGSVDGYHRHFGGIVEGRDGRLHLGYRRAAQHALTSGATLYHCYSDDGAQTVSAETMMVPSAPGFDQRGCAMIVTPTGRVLVIHDKCPVPAAAPTTFHVVYSDKNGTGSLFTYGGQIASVPFAYARSYGRIKLIPGKDGETYRLAWTPYYQSGTAPSTFRVAVWLSDAESDGLSWQESTPIVDDTSGYNECEMVAITSDIWFAVIRGPNGIGLFKTENAGSSWSFVGIVPLTSTDNQVAPSLDKFQYNGKWYLLLGYCNRSADTLVWRVAPAQDALTSANAFGGLITTETDMVNASGYQAPVTDLDGVVYTDGGTGYIEFKEYVGETYSQLRFGRMDLFSELRINPREIQASSDGTITVSSSELEPILQFDTEGATPGIDEVTDILGGYQGQIIAVQGPQTTSARDVLLKTDVGLTTPLRLLSDFRINTTTSRIVLQKTGNQWVELGRTYDGVDAAVIIANDTITLGGNSIFSYQLVDTEGGAATDTLITINGGRDGQMVFLMQASGSRDITVSSGGNIFLNTTLGNFTIANASSGITLVKRGANWYEVSRSANS